MVVAASALTGAAAQAGQSHSVARQWNEATLDAIRRDFARPNVHARNLFHVSVAMYDAWAAYDDVAKPYLHQELASAGDVRAAREEAISYAAYRLLTHRFATSPGADETLPALDAKMAELGYPTDFASTDGDSPAALGNRIAESIIAHGLNDGSNEVNDYDANNGYEPVNPPLIVDLPGNPDLVDPNRWQPLALEFFIDQSGNPIPGGETEFIGPHWGGVTPFALTEEQLSPDREGVYLDPGAPPQLGEEGAEDYQRTFADVVRFSSVLDPDLSATIDISPGAFGNNSLGADDGSGHPVNPYTGAPYAPNVVKLGDWSRVIAEFWADGPDSETPPGHWNTLANYVSDHPLLEKRFRGVGPVLDDLEWDVKLYLFLNGATHDAAVAAWGCKGHYDYIRPISAIRYMASLGQSSDPDGPSYHPLGIPLMPGVIEVITPETTTGEEGADPPRHAHLAGHEGEIAVYAWRDAPDDPTSDYTGVGWILAAEWVPYQRPTFVTPPFAGYVSGHSAFSRAAAEILTAFTGTEYFPGGVGEWFAPQNDFLVFEVGPSDDVTLQWATYYDASDESGISRLYGGIHPSVDDLPGRVMGARVGEYAFEKALDVIGLSPADFDGDGAVAAPDLGFILAGWGPCDPAPEPCASDFNDDGVVDGSDLGRLLLQWGPND